MMIFNKSDQLSPDQASVLRVEFPDCAVVSALTKAGLDGLRTELFERSALRTRAPGKAGSSAARRHRAAAVTEPLD
jgi:50S ribosomal subunit-associated GTPase HflX